MIQGQRAMSVLTVTDIDKSVDFYEDGLGFSTAGKWVKDNGTPYFAILALDRITVALQCGKPVEHNGPWCAYLYVADIEAYAAEITGKGVALHREITDQFYGCRDLEIKDPDGNVLCFGQDLSPGTDGPGL
jgi:predicted enzyme related to lactoylglutathione lyase